MVLWDFNRSKETSHYVVPAREIIIVPSTWVLIRMVHRNFPWHQKDGLVYFYCSSPQVIPLHVSLVVRYGHSLIGRVEFVDRSMVSDYHPFIRHDNTNLVILSQNFSLNVCICSVQTDPDIAKIVVHFFSDGECPLYFLQELVQFASSGSPPSMGMSKWKDLRPKSILHLASQSKLQLKSVEVSCHCVRFNPYCQLCQEKALGSPITSKPCNCYHQTLAISPETIYSTTKSGMSDSVISPRSVSQLSECFHYNEYLYDGALDPPGTIDPLAIETEFDMKGTWFYELQPAATNVVVPQVSTSSILPTVSGEDGIGESDGFDPYASYISGSI